MKLSDREIVTAIEQGRIVIEPRVEDRFIGPISVDLTLGQVFLSFRHSTVPFLDLGSRTGGALMSDELMERIEVPAEGAFYLQPGEFALGTTLEKVILPDDIAGWLDGRSSLARVGLMVHATAHTLEPGWNGSITLEFFNAGKLPLALRPGMRICAISFDPLSSPTTRPYSAKAGAKYRNQDGPQASRIADEPGVAKARP